MKILEDAGIEDDGQLYLFREYFGEYDWEVIFPKIYYALFDWHNYIGEPER